jgi:hypothetical protein
MNTESTAMQTKGLDQRETKDVVYSFIDYRSKAYKLFTQMIGEQLYFCHVFTKELISYVIVWNGPQLFGGN